MAQELNWNEIQESEDNNWSEDDEMNITENKKWNDLELVSYTTPISIFSETIQEKIYNKKRILTKEEEERWRADQDTTNIQINLEYRLTEILLLQNEANSKFIKTLQR